MIKVLLLDDHAVVRTGYRKLIDSEPDMRVVGEAANSSQACALLREQAVDIAVVDFVLKGDSGLEAVKRMLQRQSGLRILMFSMHVQEAYVLQAVRAGAHGYLSKDSDPEAMLEALRFVAGGRRLFPGEVMDALLSDHCRVRASPFAQLTPREFDVLRLAVDGHAVDDIAQSLHISPKTVHNHMSLIRSKLDVNSDFKLLRLAALYGLAHL